jgi:hypothetical protein
VTNFTPVGVLWFPKINNTPHIKGQFGKKICFWGDDIIFSNAPFQLNSYKEKKIVKS